MALATRLSFIEYSQRQFEPECELIDGELIPKPMGTLEHMQMEKRLARLLDHFEQQGLGQVVWELSIRRENDVRIPDLVFVAPEARFEGGLLIDPPLLCVEVLSPSQRPTELFAKCESYHAWGVPNCWIVDPIRKAAWEYHANSQPVKTDSELTAGPVRIAVRDLF